MTTTTTSQKSVVLVVEDEPIILMNAMDIVEDAGFEAIGAYSADAAIDILRSRNDVRIVFTDINMPGSMDGLKLAATIRDRWPPIKLVITSGRQKYSRNELPEGSRFISKPYGLEQVTDVLRRAAHDGTPSRALSA
ncbi:response regulator [Labrys monachus]|uniref:CheY-like chemotaxis protein n=1 Tax=Labrys monachus TaxID=217067 RepID=A0ABU0FPH0_9HYPH|nr:response regulator [Labrys monachus]MDQ0395999.1 CheY-like chemotaxis protein [Labrys monachus]